MKTTLSNSPHYIWGNNCDSWVLCGEENLSVKQEKMPPGTREQLHYHTKALQYFYILSGTATFTVGGEVIEIQKGEGIKIIPGAQHFIANNGEVDLDFLVISQPPTDADRVNV